MIDTPSPVAVRLSPDAMYLEVYLAEGTAEPAIADAVALIKDECERLGVAMPKAADEIAALAQSWQSGTWNRLISAVAPTPPVNGQVEILVPVAVSQHGGGAQRAPYDVQAGTPLARLKRGTVGTPGQDLLGRAIPARVPREARLPQGQNTHVSDDGKQLLAACAGQVVLRDLRLHIVPPSVPMHQHHGDLTAAHGPLRSALRVLVTGSVCAGAVIETDGDIHIQGDAHCAEVTSRAGSIIVAGSVSGTAARPSIICAGKNVSCHTIRYAQVQAAGDLHLGESAWSSKLSIVGDLYLPSTLAACLLDVELMIGGAVIPAPETLLSFPPPPAERQHLRAGLTIGALLALHDTPPLTFQSGFIEDISVGGLRFRAADAGAMPATPGAVMQVKFTPPDGLGQIVAVARLIRVIAPGVMGLNFMQMTQRDRDRLSKICRHLILARRHTSLGHLNDRKQA